MSLNTSCQVGGVPPNDEYWEGRLEGIAMGRARAIDVGVGNAVFNETISVIIQK